MFGYKEMLFLDIKQIFNVIKTETKLILQYTDLNEYFPIALSIASLVVDGFSNGFKCLKQIHTLWKSIYCFSIEPFKHFKLSTYLFSFNEDSSFEYELFTKYV